jgi:hypothetical protein
MEMNMPGSALATIESSNMSARDKSYFSRLLEGGHRGLGHARRVGSMAKVHLESTGDVVGEFVTSGATSLALAAVDVYQPNGGLDWKRNPSATAVPIDGVVAGLGALLSIFGAGHRLAPMARNVGSGAFDVLLFRKGHAYFTEKHQAAGGVPAGSMSPGPAAAPSAPAAAAPAGGSTTSFGNDHVLATARDLAAQL